ncbi:hypothetical protein HBE99_10085 [Mycobacteroides chelonae]|uniref:hypothetical protein n=1 Tax=Mycobacteroides chelonae TaxID=1774 RepID=UPI001910546B|nr:hypothetical protein [Mycobacteroides chelonae]QQG97137.1 hypothetical protein HBE99_10085 [Mycobacteroides chelonae]
MSGTVATTGDPVIQVHKNTAQSAREAAGALPVVPAVGMRLGHAELLESALVETARTLEELGRVADIGAAGASGLGEQDSDNAGKYDGVRSVQR